MIFIYVLLTFKLILKTDTIYNFIRNQFNILFGIVNNHFDDPILKIYILTY